MPARAPKEKIPVRPPLKWAGGKRWLIPHIKPLWEAHKGRRLVEPLCGGLAVALELRPRRALLNDINPHVGNFYRWLKNGLIIEDLEMANDEDVFYEHRRRFNDLLRDGKKDSREAAGLFYYLNRTCYNGLCRFNSKGEFNVPFGRYAKINYQRDFSSYRGVLYGWKFTTGDFKDIVLEPEDFIYADPPYDVEFTKYAKEDFKWEDQQRLAEWLFQHKGPVVASNQATDRVMDLYERLGFTVDIYDAPRRISCTGDRTPAKEMLAQRGI